MHHHPGDHPAVRQDPGEQLLASYARQPDPVLRRQIVERYLPLARYAASHYVRGVEPFDDLMQVASIGLLKAIERFDPHNGAAFSSYALPTMHGELRRHLRDHTWTVRPPRTLQEDALRVAKVTDEPERRGRRALTVDEVAVKTGMTIEAVLDARKALAARYAGSLSAPSESDGRESEVDRRHGVVDDGYARAEDRATMDAMAAGALTRRERQIVRLRFEQDLTQSEIGQRIGLSQMHVSRVLQQALEKLRTVASTAVVAADGR